MTKQQEIPAQSAVVSEERITETAPSKDGGSNEAHSLSFFGEEAT